MSYGLDWPLELQCPGFWVLWPPSSCPTLHRMWGRGEGEEAGGREGEETARHPCNGPFLQGDISPYPPPSISAGPSPAHQGRTPKAPRQPSTCPAGPAFRPSLRSVSRRGK